VETETITFQVGLDGLMAAPGQIVKVVDHARAGVRNGGRITAATQTQITLDHAPGSAAVGDTININMPDVDTDTLPIVRSQSRTISAISGNVVSVSSAFSTVPAVGAVWSVESTALAA
jgi:predicted phage tail protein